MQGQKSLDAALDVKPAWVACIFSRASIDNVVLHSQESCIESLELLATSLMVLAIQMNRNKKNYHVSQKN